MGQTSIGSPDTEVTKSGGLFKNLPLRSVRERKGYHWFVVGTVCVGAFMAALDASIINIALPTFQGQFHAPLSAIEWISLVYLLTLAALIVPFGRLADMVGRRWMYAFGFTIFIIGSLLCGLSPNLTALLIFRVIQAVGAAMLQSNSVSIITAITPAAARGKAIGIQASAQGVGLSLGPAIGGALIAFLNWRWIFFVNLPVGIIGTTLGILLLPADEKHEKREKFDFLGALFLTPALVGVIYVLNQGLKLGWGSPVILSIIAATVVCFLAFLWVERRTIAPMVDLQLFKNAAFSLGNLTGMISFAVMYAVLLLTPFYLDGVQKLSTFVAGLILTIIPLGLTLMTPISGAIADRFGTRVPTVAGMTGAVIGCVLLAFMGAGNSTVFLVAGLFLVGAALGIFTPPNNSSVMGSAPPNRLGVAGGILNMSRTVGTGFGVTLGGLTYQLFLTVFGAHEKSPTIGQMVDAFHGAYLVAGVIALIALILSIVRKKQMVKRTPESMAMD